MRPKSKKKLMLPPLALYGREDPLADYDLRGDDVLDSLRSSPISMPNKFVPYVKERDHIGRLISDNAPKVIPACANSTHCYIVIGLSVNFSGTFSEDKKLL
jgi:hypothetical protein